MTAEKKMTEPEKLIDEKRRLRRRNWALFAALVGFVVLVYFVSIVRMSGALQ